MNHIIKNFATWYVLGLFLYFGSATILQLYFDIDIGFSGSSVILLVAATGITGINYAQRHGEVPDSGLSWKVAFYTIPIPWIASGLAVSVLLLLDENVLAAIVILIGSIPYIAAAVAVFLTILHVLAVRWLFPTFARMHVRTLDKRKTW